MKAAQPNSTPAPIALTKKGEAYCAGAGERLSAPETYVGPSTAPEPQEAPQGLVQPFGVDTSLTDRMKAAVGVLERLAEEIIAQLDVLQGDCDLEFEPDEHSLGWTATIDQSKRQTGTDEDEPSLGAIWCTAAAVYGDQRSWASGGREDLEEEHDGREPDQDGEPFLGASEGPTGSCGWNNISGVFGEEPSLGSVERVDQGSWGHHLDPAIWTCIDAEQQCEDEGAVEAL